MRYCLASPAACVSATHAFTAKPYLKGFYIVFRLRDTGHASG